MIKNEFLDPTHRSSSIKKDAYFLLVTSALIGLFFQLTARINLIHISTYKYLICVAFSTRIRERDGSKLLEGREGNTIMNAEKKHYYI